MLLFRPLSWWRSDTNGVEVVSAWCATAWGLLLLCPGSTFAQSETYDAMAALASEGLWGWAYLSIGILQSLAMCGNADKLRYPAALLALAGWVASATLLFIGQPITHAAVTDLVMALAMFWVILRGPQ